MLQALAGQHQEEMIGFRPDIAGGCAMTAPFRDSPNLILVHDRLWQDGVAAARAEAQETNRRCQKAKRRWNRNRSDGNLVLHNLRNLPMRRRRRMHEIEEQFLNLTR